MIDYSAFSRDAFDRAGRDSSTDRDLADNLAETIQSDLHLLIHGRVFEIVDELNRQGHDLKPYGPEQPGDISFRDGGDFDCRLRVTVDTVISTEYSHLLPDDDSGDA